MDFFDYRKIVHQEERIEDIYRLRYKVYCLECGYEKPSDYLNGLESDFYDPVSTHFFAAEKKSGNIVGTARIIRSSEKGFPALKYFDINDELLPAVPEEQVGEISRLAVSKEYRRRAVDKAIFSSDKVISFCDRKEKNDMRRRLEADLVSGLYHCIYRESIELGLTHLYAVMSESLYAILKKWGLEFKPIGESVDYHGIRRPYVAAVEENMHWFESSRVMVAQA